MRPSSAKRLYGLPIALLAICVVGMNSRVAVGQCRSDCNLDNKVEITDLLTIAAIIFESQPTSICPLGADENDDGEITVGDIVAAVDVARTGICQNCQSQCGDGVAGCGEECDVGGTCVGGANSGTACVRDEVCGLSEPGRCEGGLLAFQQCMSDDDCGGGTCRRCVMFGGHAVPGGTCASNCTMERELTINLKPGVFDGTTLTGGSGVVEYSNVTAAVPFVLDGRVVIGVGGEGSVGIRPVTIRSAPALGPFAVGTLACSCVRPIAAKTCGGVVRLLDGSASLDCTADYTDGDAVCTSASLPPCTFVHGEGNSGSGFLGCNGLSPIDVTTTVGSAGEPDLVLLSGDGDPGSMLLLQHTATGVKTGSCEGFCSDNDPQAMRGAVQPQFLTTGVATVDLGLDVLPYAVSGLPKPCPELLASPSGLKLGGAIHSTIGDPSEGLVVTTSLEAQ